MEFCNEYVPEYISYSKCILPRTLNISGSILVKTLIHSTLQVIRALIISYLTLYTKRNWNYLKKCLGICTNSLVHYMHPRCSDLRFVSMRKTQKEALPFTCLLHDARAWSWAARKSVSGVCPVLSTVGEIAVLHSEQNQHGSSEPLNRADKNDRAIHNNSWLVFRKDWALITYSKSFVQLVCRQYNFLTP